MKKQVLWKSFVCIALITLLTIAGNSYQSESNQLQKEVSGAADEKETVLLGGMPIGIYMDTDGVMVLDTDTVTDRTGEEYHPAENIVKPGDYIEEFNGEPVADKKELIHQIKECRGSAAKLKIRRKQESLEVKLLPVLSQDGYKLGIWVRDNVQGLGTITYLDGESHFASLGHGIHDLDTGKLLEISSGLVYKTSIRSIQKGQKGFPGSMEGIIVYNNYNKLGTIDQNLETGVFGKIDKIEEVFQEQVPITLGKKEEVTEGIAYMRCSVNDEIANYEIKISNIDHSQKEVNKSFEIEVCDKKLLELTGGIIQGMFWSYNSINTGNPHK